MHVRLMTSDNRDEMSLEINAEDWSRICTISKRVRITVATNKFEWRRSEISWNSTYADSHGLGHFISRLSIAREIMEFLDKKYKGDFTKGIEETEEDFQRLFDELLAMP